MESKKESIKLWVGHGELICLTKSHEFRLDSDHNLCRNSKTILRKNNWNNWRSIVDSEHNRERLLNSVMRKLWTTSWAENIVVSSILSRLLKYCESFHVWIFWILPKFSKDSDNRKMFRSRSILNASRIRLRIHKTYY